MRRIVASSLIFILLTAVGCQMDVPTATPWPTRTLATPSADLRYDPYGPDRDCPDFFTQREAQDFYLAAGGPTRDPHRLDRDRDGFACEALP